MSVRNAPVGGGIVALVFLIGTPAFLIWFYPELRRVEQMLPDWPWVVGFFAAVVLFFVVAFLREGRPERGRKP